MIQPGRWRSKEELEPIAQQVAASAALVKLIREVVGCEDAERVRNATYEVTRFVEELDPSYGLVEGTRIFVMVLEKLGYFKEDGTTKNG